MATEQIARRLVTLCREGKFGQVHDELFAEDAVSIDPDDLPQDALGNAQGLAEIRHKGRQFEARTEKVHGIQVSDPVVAGNWFSVSMALDATMKERGRMTLREICVYHVSNGRIDREQFFFDPGR